MAVRRIDQWKELEGVWLIFYALRYFIREKENFFLLFFVQNFGLLSQMSDDVLVSLICLRALKFV